MLGVINHKNIHLIIPYKVSWLVDMMAEERGVDLKEALILIYNSNMYKKLINEETKYWHLGPVDLFRELQSEL